MSDETDSSLIPELGDLVTFLSDAYTSTTGRIVYRDGNLIRICPYNGSSSAIDFPLDSESGMFIESLGVSEVIIHEKRIYIQFSKQLGTAPGEALEFFDIDGKPVGEPGIVHRVYASDTEDAVKMEDGTVHDFRFVGPQLPIAVIRPRATPEEEVVAENNSAPSANEVELADELSDELYPDVNFDLLPAALVEEVPSEEQTFSDSVQREDMFISLLLDFPVKRQKDPKVMQRIYRATDVLLALKNSVVTRDDSGAVLPDAPSRSYTATTIQDVLLKQPTGAPVAALVPVAAVKKVLYADTFTVGDYNHVEFRSDIETLVDVARVEQGFSESTQGQNGFATYIRDLLKTIDTYVPSGEEASDERIRVDQDVLRSEIPPNPVEGFPTVPASVDKRGNPNMLTNEYVGGIDDRYVRLLSASYSRNPNTGTILNVAPADTATTVAHVVLSKSMTKYRSPVRSSVLLWDIQASEQSRSRSLFYSTLMKQWENQQVVNIHTQEQNVAIVDLFHKRLQPALAFMSQDNVETMDSLGMRTLEFTDDILKPFVNSANAGQTVWKSAFAKLQGRAIESMGLPTFPAIPAVAPGDSGLMTALTDPVMTDAVKSIQEKETSLANHDLVLANDILKRADATLGPYWYALAGMVPPEIKTATEMAYVSEAARFKRNTIVRRDRAKEFTAQPSLNACTHVKELEKLRGIRDDDSRMLIFDKFLKNYQAGVRGNWVLCGSCGEDLVCKHEVLLLNEFLNPGRGSTLHKALLLDFAGPVFEGAYICKNCGQKIQELEYDTHLEFDDSGRPLIGRNVVEDEEEKEKDETNVAVAIADEDAPPFKGSDLTLYYNFRTLFERCGMAMDLETYTRVVAAAQDFLNTNVPPKSAYEKRQATLTAAKKPIGPAYESYFANFQIGILGALVLLELQTSSVHVPIPAVGCAFRRDGFPLDGIDISTAGNGALNYVVCVLMSITRNDPPWNLTPWAGLTGKPRQSEVEKVVKGTLYSLLCIPAVAGAAIPPPLTNVTNNYRTRLADAATLKTQLAMGTSAAASASSSDKLPSSFRPLPRVVLPSTVTEHPIGNMGRFQSDVENGDVSKIGPVVFGRQYELTLQVLSEFHKKGVDSGIVLPNNPRSDSVCCFSRLGAVGLRGLGIGSLELAEAKSAEIKLHTDATRRVQRRDPARSSTGTHIFVPWSAPITTKVDPSPDASMYYNLFLKHCFRGRNYGLVHEFGPNLECRQCHFKYPEELVYLTGSEISETNGGKREKALEDLAKRRKEIALNAFMTDIRGAEINETTFHALEMTIRQKKTIHPPLALTPGSFLELLERLAHFPVLLPEAVADWKSLQTAMIKIQKEGLTGVKRVKALEDISKRYDVRLATLKATLTLGGGAKVMDSLARITEDSEGNVNVRNVFNIFVTSASQVANKFSNVKPKTKKWFPKISRHHDELLIKIWQKSASVTTTTLSILQRLEDEEQEVVKKALKRFADWYGPWLALWMESMRVNMGFTEEEFVFALRWSVFSSLLALLTPSSPLFADSPSVATSATAAKFIQGWLVEALTDATASVEKYQLTATQVTEEINARAELEKASFIQKFDKLDRDLRQVELIKKKLKIGDWAVGTVKNLFSYDADFFEFERDQRAAMGLPEFAGDVTGAEGADATSAAERFGFYQFGDQEIGMEDGSNHRAEQDEDV